jgi:hypothetical protein
MMKIKFRGQHNAEEVVESLAAIVRMFEEQYGVLDFDQIKVSMTLINDFGEEVELIDAGTSEIFEVLEVHKAGEADDADDLEAFETIDEAELEEYDELGFTSLNSGATRGTLH